MRPTIQRLMRQTRAGGVLALAWVASTAPSWALELDVRAGTTAALPRFEHGEVEIRVDGQLDEPIWAKIPSFDAMTVLEPDLLVAPRYGTRIRMFYTDRGLYVAFDNEQPAETIIKRLSQRDDGGLNRDSVGITLDTSGDGRYGYWMNLALGDNQIDGTILPERRYSRDWDGAWYGGTAEYAGGWSAEYFIPWSQMAMPGSGDSRRIGVYASRKVAHINERWGWPALPSSRARFMSDLHPVVLDAVNPRQQWSLFPYASATVDRIADEQRYKAGFDMFWRPSSNFQLSAAANPDFGGVESDDVIVNLTAFEAFFPEKRLFFLEGQEVFTTSLRATDNDDPVTLVNTRRIGGPARAPVVTDGRTFTAQELGQPSELFGALKATGQVGNWRYGFLGASEEDVKLDAVGGGRFVQNGRDFAVGRMLYEGSRQGDYRALGVISTLTAHPESDALVHGVDFHYLTPEGTWKYDGQLMYSDVDDVGEGHGGLLDIEHTPRPGLKYQANLAFYDDRLEINDLGFLRRNDIFDMRLGASLTRSGLTRVRDLDIDPFLRYERNGDGLMTRAGLGSRLRFTLQNLDRVDTRLAYFPARYEDKNSFGNGSYRVEDRASMSLRYRTDTSRPLSLTVGSAYEGEGLVGDRWQYRAGVVWRPVDRLNLQLEGVYVRRDGWLLHQQERDMTAFRAEEWKPSMKMDFFFSARQQFRVALQWVGIKADEAAFFRIPERPGGLIEVTKPEGPADDFTLSQLNVQMRYRWQIAPLSDLFVVYTRNGVQSPQNGSFGELFRSAFDEPLGDELVVKLRYRLGS